MAIAHDLSAAHSRRSRRSVHMSRWTERLAVTVISLLGLVGVVVAVYLVVVLGLGVTGLSVADRRHQRSFSVESPNSTSSMVIIQKRTTTWFSFQPFNS